MRRKRQLDRTFFTNEPLFSPVFAERYATFINACFWHYSGVAEPAKLRTPLEEQKRERNDWEPEWDAMFAPDRESSRQAIRSTYDAVMDAFAAEVGMQAQRVTKWPLARAIQTDRISEARNQRRMTRQRFLKADADDT